MLGNMLSEKEINFNDLEKEIFELGCEVARNTMANVLLDMDKRIAKSQER